MYQSKKYIKQNRHYIFQFIQNHPFAVFVINGNRLLATHIPILTEGNAKNFRLFGHIAYNNEQYPHLKNEAEALLVFKGPDAYVSSSWYQKKDISTWDYSAVHINAKLKIQSREELELSLEKLVERFEQGQQSPLYYNQIPKGILEEHLPWITGFWCEPHNIQGIAKFHQGHDKNDIGSIVKNLEETQNPPAALVGEQIKKEHGYH